MPLALGVLISARGSNLMAILDAIDLGKLDASVKVVVSNKANAAGLVRARERGVETVFLDPKEFVQEVNSRESYDSAVCTVLGEHGVECVALAGYMRIVTPVLIRKFPWKILNIHPSLLPAFPGLHAQRQALKWGAKVSGCTVHFVTEGVDEGPIIGQVAVSIVENETVETLSAKILEQEHQLYPRALQFMAEGRLTRENRMVRIHSLQDTLSTVERAGATENCYPDG